MIPPIYSNDKIINDEKVKKNIIILYNDRLFNYCTIHNLFLFIYFQLYL